MKKAFVIALATVLLAGFAADAAARGRHRTSVGLYFGAGPGWWGGSPWHWRQPFFYDPWFDPWWHAPRTVIIEREPPVYIQRPQVQMAPAAPQVPVAPVAPVAPRVWYYCTDPAGYYPYVPNCNQPWVSVDPSSVAPPPPGK